MRAINSNIDRREFNLLVAFYFNGCFPPDTNHAWFFDEPGSLPQPGIFGDLHSRDLIYIAERLPKRNGIDRVKFEVTDAGEKVIKTVFSADPDQVIEACQMYPLWVQTEVTDVLSVDISQLPELLVSEDPIVSGTASLALSWLQEGQVMELVDMASSNLVG